MDPVPNSGAVPGSAPLPKVPAPQQDEATGKIPGAPSPEAEQGSSEPQGEGDASWQAPDRKPGSGTDWSSVFEGWGASMDAAVNEAGQAAEVALREAKKVMSTAAKEAKEALKDGSFLGVVWPKAESASQPEREDYTYQTPVGGPVKSLRIEWVKGSVELIPWEGDTIRVAEYAAKELTQENRMDLREKNGKLTIRWSREDAIFGKLGLKKRLVVEVPETPFWKRCVWIPCPAGWICGSWQRDGSEWRPCPALCGCGAVWRKPPCKPCPGIWDSQGGTCPGS